MGVSEKRSLRYVVGPRSIQINTCGGFLCHAVALKNINKKPKNRNADKGANGLTMKRLTKKPMGPIAQIDPPR